MLKRTPPMPREFARQLLAHEAATGKAMEGEASAAFRVCENLRGPLAKLLGLEGFCSLLSRALALAAADVQWLRALHINGDGSLEGIGDLEPKQDRRAVEEGEVVLVGQLLG